MDPNRSGPILPCPQGRVEGRHDGTVCDAIQAEKRCPDDAYDEVVNEDHLSCIHDGSGEGGA